MLRANVVFFLSFIFGNKQQDITSISQHFIIIQSDQDLCPLQINEYYRMCECAG